MPIDAEQVMKRAAEMVTLLDSAWTVQERSARDVIIDLMALVNEQRENDERYAEKAKWRKDTYGNHT